MTRCTQGFPFVPIPGRMVWLSRFRAVACKLPVHVKYALFQLVRWDSNSGPPSHESNTQPLNYQWPKIYINMFIITTHFHRVLEMVDSLLFWSLSCHDNTMTKKPTNGGTKAADVLDNFFGWQTLMWIRWIFRCICNYYDFTWPISSKYCIICYTVSP